MDCKTHSAFVFHVAETPARGQGGVKSDRKSINAEEGLGRAFPSLTHYCSSNATPFSLKESVLLKGML